MKAKQHFFIIALSILFIAPMAKCFGQEAAGSPSYESYDPEMDREREKVISSPGESSEVVINVSKPSTISTAKDSATPVHRNIKPAAAAETPKNSAKPKNEDDSILSFNFLYYIIQKYKLQDIVD